MSRGHARPVIDIVSPTVVAAKTTIIEAAVKKPIEPKADVVTVAKFSETVDDGLGWHVSGAGVVGGAINCCRGFGLNQGIEPVSTSIECAGRI